MDGIANALFHFDKKDIPIFYDESTEKITVYFGDEGVALPDHMNKIIVKRLGVLTDGLILYKLSVPLFNTCTIMDGDTLVGSCPFGIIAIVLLLVFEISAPCRHGLNIIE